MLIETDRPIADQAVAAMNAVIEPFREQLGIDHVEIAPEGDFDGDPVIYARFKHRLVKAGISLETIRVMESQMRDSARANGERRFVHTEHVFHDRQEVARSR